MSTSDDKPLNLDLATAEEILIAAGRPELARALHFHADGVRNLVQGEWGIAFVNALDSILGKHVDPIGTAIEGLRSEVATRLGKLESGQRTYNARLSALDTRHGRQWQEMIDRLTEDEKRLDRKRQELDDHAARLARIEARLGLDGDV